MIMATVVVVGTPVPVATEVVATDMDKEMDKEKMEVG
jgi:hypothetical protein